MDQTAVVELTSDARESIIRCMTRTTVDIDPTVLAEAKELARKRGKTLGDTLSVLLAEALAEASKPKARPPFRWASQPMHALIDLEDKDAVCAILDSDEFRSER
ncbi:MAG: hypothetical protein ACRDG3_09170 [Tepidiformaceae bacterium]